VLCATNWWGLDEFDVPSLVYMAVFNNTDFSIVPDRCQQGVLNFMVLTRLMTGGAFANDPAVIFNGKSVINTTLVSYSTYYLSYITRHCTSLISLSLSLSPCDTDGNSQGGIMGGTFMSTTPDILSGVLGVPGAPFSLLLPRSQDFADFYDIFKIKYGNQLDRIFLLTFFQQLWDRYA